VKAALAIRRTFQSLAALALIMGTASAALAATSPMAACDKAPELQSLDVYLSDLSTTVVGHSIEETDTRTDEPAGPLPAPSAPVLDLGPRLAIILEDVFSAVAIETPPLQDDDRQPSSLIEAVPQDKSPLSPVAGDSGQSEGTERTETNAAPEKAATVPIFQRRMRRTDI
jgi:hypothetical protein